MKLKMFCLIAVVLAALPAVAYGEHYVELESGTVYVQANGNTYSDGHACREQAVLDIATGD